MVDNSKPYRASINSKGFMVEKNPNGDITINSIFIGRFKTFREAAQTAREMCIEMGILGDEKECISLK